MPQGTDLTSTPEDTTGVVTNPEDTTSVVTDPEVSPDGEGTSAPEEYVPDFKYKAMQEERELPEWVRPALTSKEQEEEIKKIFSRAGGQEHFEKKYNELNTRLTEHYTPLEQKYQQQQLAFNQLNQYAQNNDWRSFFNTLKVPQQAVLSYAKDILEYQDLSPEQKQAVDQHYLTQQQYEQAQWQNQQLQQNWQQQQVQLRTMQLDMEMTKPEVAKFREQFDTLAGREGAFRDTICREGAMLWNTQQLDMDPASLVQRVIGQYPGVNTLAPQAPGQGQPQPGTNTVVQKPNNAPTLPTIQGGGASPVKRQVRSLADIAKIREELEAREI